MRGVLTNEILRSHLTDGNEAVVRRRLTRMTHDIVKVHDPRMEAAQRNLIDILQPVHVTIAAERITSQVELGLICKFKKMMTSENVRE